MREISWLAQRLLASPQEFYSMQLVSTDASVFPMSEVGTPAMLVLLKVGNWNLQRIEDL
jgi:hypothetical protein